MATMSTDSPLAQTLAGLAGRGRAQRDYLLYLFMQAVVVFVWWPKSSLREVLEIGDGPDTLRAAVIAAGVAIAWFSARAGAQEVLLPGQRGLRELARHGARAPARLLAADIAGYVLHSVHLLALSSPLLLMAFAVSGGDARALAWCAAAIVFHAAFFRLAAASVHLQLGGAGAMSIVLVRAVVVATYLLTAVFAPAASHPVLASRLLDGDAGAAGASPALLFMLVYGLLSALLAVLLYAQLTRLRRDAPGAAAGA